MSVLIFLIVSYVLLSISLYKVFEKAGVDPKKALIPGVNFMEWCKIIGRPSWWAALLLIPIVNIFIYAGMAVDMVRSFGKYDFKDSALAVIYAPISFFLLGSNAKEKYLGPTLDKEREFANKLMALEEKGDKYKLEKLQKNNPYRKSVGREWIEAIVFAVFAAAFIRMFLIEAYVIPTSSMEGSLLTGDFLFVSKAHYGIRTPQTIAMFPLLHNRIPFLNKESYLESPKLGYFRFPAFESIDNNDPIVFNYPEGDSVYIFPNRAFSVHDIRRGSITENRVKGKKMVTRPVDKRDHYIKRCLGIPGDSLQIIDKQVHINGKPLENPPNMQFLYKIQTNAAIVQKRLDEWGVNMQEAISLGDGIGYFLNYEQVEKLKSFENTIVTPYNYPQPDNPLHLFPQDPKITAGWTMDNYGPIYIPKEGVTTPLNMNNISFYKRVIGVYENNKLEIRNGKIFINDQESDSYTFKQNYYWAMGDNRHNSEDARVWGYVPEDHIVGKPLFIWFSTKYGSIGNGIRWNRIFTGAEKMTD